jgi:hypothetical protein
MNAPVLLYDRKFNAGRRPHAFGGYEFYFAPLSEMETQPFSDVFNADAASCRGIRIQNILFLEALSVIFHFEDQFAGIRPKSSNTDEAVAPGQLHSVV